MAGKDVCTSDGWRTTTVKEQSYEDDSTRAFDISQFLEIILEEKDNVLDFCDSCDSVRESSRDKREDADSEETCLCFTKHEQNLVTDESVNTDETSEETEEGAIEAVRQCTDAIAQRTMEFSERLCDLQTTTCSKISYLHNRMDYLISINTDGDKDELLSSSEEMLDRFIDINRRIDKAAAPIAKCLPRALKAIDKLEREFALELERI